MEVADRIGEGKGGLDIVYHSLGHFDKVIEFNQRHLSIGVEEDNRAGEGTAFSASSAKPCTLNPRNLRSYSAVLSKSLSSR